MPKKAKAKTKGSRRGIKNPKKKGQMKSKGINILCTRFQGDFAGGGESSTSRKKYVRQVILFQEDNKQALERELDITFSPKHDAKINKSEPIKVVGAFSHYSEMPKVTRAFL